MEIIRKELPFRGEGSEHGLTLISDTHIGAAGIQYDRIESELKQARKNGDRINVNGDIFDAILPKDQKRFRPDALDERFWGRSDVLDVAVEIADDIFGPYADLIDVIGFGNHEAAIDKYHGTDLIARLIRRLNSRKGAAVQYGGYTGYIDYRFRAPKRSRQCRLVVYYHHGAGGASPQTRGMLDFSRLVKWVDADIVWIGHKHNRIVDATGLRMRCPLQGDEPKYDQQVCVMTGSYRLPPHQSPAKAMAQGRRSDYAEEMGLGPQAAGGMRALVQFTPRAGGGKRISVVM